MKKTKFSLKNGQLKKNPTIEKKDFLELLRRAVSPSRPSPKQSA